MSTLKVVASGSSGNAYVLTAGNDRLVLEAGVSEKTLLKALNYDLEGVVGVLVSHGHLDHAKYIPQISEYFPVYGNSDLSGAFPQVKALEPKNRYKIGEFSVMPLEVEHGVPNFAYIIDHTETGRVVFITDCVSFPYKIKDVVTAIVECNWVEDVVFENAMKGNETRSQVNMHMELTESIEAVKRMQNPLLRNVILCHLSSSNADRKIITERFEQELDITPQFATRGKEFNINQFDF